MAHTRILYPPPPTGSFSIDHNSLSHSATTDTRHSLYNILLYHLAFRLLVHSPLQTRPRRAPMPHPYTTNPSLLLALPTRNLAMLHTRAESPL